MAEETFGARMKALADTARKAQINAVLKGIIVRIMADFEREAKEGKYSIVLAERDYELLYNTGECTFERQELLSGLRGELKNLGLRLTQFESDDALDDAIYSIEIADS